MTVAAHFLEGSLTIDLFLQSPKSLFHWFAFF